MVVKEEAERIYARERRKRYKKRLIQNRKTLGLCVDCGKPSPKFYRCESCRKALCLIVLRRRERLKREGLCTRCAKRKANRGFMCEECASLTTKKNMQNKIDKKMNLIKLFDSKCQNCGYCKNYSALSFHHIHGRDKPIKSIARMTPQQVRENFMLLCENCHRELHHPKCNLC